VDYSGFKTINPQRFGQKYVGKVANPQDILIFSKVSRKGRTTEGKIDDAEKLRPEEINQQNIEALVAESNLKMEILPVNDLDVALHNFVSKDDKMAFYSCVQYNLDETRERVIERSTRVKEKLQFTSEINSEDAASKDATGAGNVISFSDDDDDDMPQLTGPKATRRGSKVSSPALGSSRDASQLGKAPTRGRDRGRGKASGNLKQTTLDGSLGFRRSDRMTRELFLVKCVKEQLQGGGAEARQHSSVGGNQRALPFRDCSQARMMTTTTIYQTE
ncbi:hypothetical protein Droror1_Dr00021602, partial [Drosera rotundifolia]